MFKNVSDTKHGTWVFTCDISFTPALNFASVSSSALCPSVQFFLLRRQELGLPQSCMHLLLVTQTSITDNRTRWAPVGHEAGSQGAFFISLGDRVHLAPVRMSEADSLLPRFTKIGNSSK